MGPADPYHLGIRPALPSRNYLHRPCMLHPDPADSAHWPSCSCSRCSVSMAANPSSSNSKEDLAVHGMTLTLALAHHGHASSSDHQNRRSRCWAPGLEYSNVTWDEQEKTLNDGEEEAASSGGSVRKKLRLSKEESALLEERFKEQSTLTPKQKSELAEQLNLRPRQIEVWFQNRRARTKLKQTELDCKLLKKCCASLTEENRQLHNELAQLRAFKLQPNPKSALDFGVSTPSRAVLTICAQCERVSSQMATSSSSTATSNSSLHQTLLNSSPVQKLSPAPSSS